MIQILSPPEPDADIVNQDTDFIKQRYNSASNKMEIIMQQKYIHLNMIGIYELWTELRCTPRPRHESVITLNATKTKVQLERARYPSSEQSVNMETTKKCKRKPTIPRRYSSGLKKPSKSF